MSLSYPWLHETVRKRFDSDAAMEAFLPQPLSAAELEAQGDDRCLSAMTQRVFHAGVQHSMVDAKWPAFEEALQGFEPKAMAALSPARIDALMKDARLIRHRAKLETIPKNAAFVLAVAREHGSFAAFIADWRQSPEELVHRHETRRLLDEALAQLDENLDAWNCTLPPELLAEIDALHWELGNPAL